MKYEFTGKLFRRGTKSSLRQIKRINDGLIGGWIEKQENLSQEGDCWVSKGAKVFGNARISENAQVSGNAQVLENAQIMGHAIVSGNSVVYGNSIVFGNSRVYGNIIVSGNSRIYGNAQVFGNSRIYGHIISGNSRICGNTRIYDDTTDTKRDNVQVGQFFPILIEINNKKIIIKDEKELPIHSKFLIIATNIETN